MWPRPASKLTGQQTQRARNGCPLMHLDSRFRWKSVFSQLLSRWLSLRKCMAQVSCCCTFCWATKRKLFAQKNFEGLSVEAIWKSTAEMGPLKSPVNWFHRFWWHEKLCRPIPFKTVAGAVSKCCLRDPNKYWSVFKPIEAIRKSYHFSRLEPEKFCCWLAHSLHQWHGSKKPYLEIYTFKRG